jgi:flagellar P-ring protein precursor FlgI
MSRSFFASVLALAVAAVALVSTPADAKSRIKDIVAFEGVRDNQLVGYGIVVGLNGSGDSLRNAPMTKQSLEAMLERQGVNVRDGNLNTKNTAAVMVTANLPPFSATGARMDVTVSTLGDAMSMDVLRMTLRNPDFTTSRRIADAINQRFPNCAQAQNPTIVAVRPPAGMDMISFVTNIENLEVEPDAPAKVIIDEVAGVIVMGDDVRISQVAIAQGNLTISVQETPAVSQPAPFSQGQTRVVPQSTVSVNEETGRQLLTLGGGASLKSLVGGLNALGVTPRDMISILQAIKASGALQADIEVM